MTSPRSPAPWFSRRHLLRNALAVAGVGVLAPGARSMTAVPGAARDLPAIGQTVALSGPATLTLNGQDLTAAPAPLHWTGSRVVKVLAGGVDFVRLRILAFTVEAVHPQLGKITLKLPDIDVTPLSVLQVRSAGLLASWLMSFDAAFEDGTKPTTLEPAKWTAQPSPWGDAGPGRPGSEPFGRYLLSAGSGQPGARGTGQVVGAWGITS
ncbi:hypothetical protein ACWFQ8_18230 [Streptomyces sp. NPDC055254]